MGMINLHYIHYLCIAKKCENNIAEPCGLLIFYLIMSSEVILCEVVPYEVIP